MATNQASEVFRHLRRAAFLQEGAGLTDGQLLESFVSLRDQAAMEVLVRRHGPMVWGVCRRVLQNHQDAEDAFQATFLVLVRRAGSIASREQLANWLYGVAHQTALKARATVAKRKRRERQVMSMPEPAAAEQDLWDDLRPLLDQELSRLPDKYRAILVLCDLGGKSRKDVARQLGLPEGTVASRLARARAMLANRLRQRGVPLSAGALAAVLSQEASAGVPVRVLSSTIRTVVAATGPVSVKVAVLAGAVVKAMLLSKAKAFVAVVLAATLLAATVGVVSSHVTAGRGEPEPVNAAKPKGTPDRQDEIAWGQEQGGLQAGLAYRPGRRRAYRLGETVTLVIRVRNVGRRDVRLHYPRQCVVDNPPAVTDAAGKPAAFTPFSRNRVRKGSVEKTLAPGEEVELDSLDIALKPSGKDDVSDVPTVFARPGKYRVRMKRLAPTASGNVLSKLATGELGLEVTDTWGVAVGGVQVRLRPRKPRWAVGEFPSFDLDMRNADTKEGKFGFPRLAAFCEIEVDGQWYGQGIGAIRALAYPLKPGEEVKPWVSVSLDAQWAKGVTGFERGKEGHVHGKPVKLPAGRHTVRVAFAPWPEGVRLVSRAVEIEVVGGKRKLGGDERRIQGKWQVANAGTGGPQAVDEHKEVLVRGDMLTLLSKGRTYPMRYTLDPTKQPKAIDLVSTPGGAETFKGIYKLEEVLGIGEQLTVCFSRGAARPVAFEQGKQARADRGRTLYVLRRPPAMPRDLHGEWESPVNGVFESGVLVLRPGGKFRYEMHDFALGWTTTVSGRWRQEADHSLVLQEEERLQDGRPVKGQKKMTEHLCPVYTGGQWRLLSSSGSGREFRKVTTPPRESK